MGVNTFPNIVPHQMKNYTRFDTISDSGVVVDGEYKEVLSVTGKGFLDTAYITYDGSHDIYIKVTIDGVEKHESKNGAAVSKATGLFQSKSTVSDASSLCSVVMNGLSAYPLTDASASSVVLSEPIYFSTSLKIEVKKVGATTAVNYGVFGGTL